MTGHVDEADTSAKRKRETREERVARAICRSDCQRNKLGAACFKECSYSPQLVIARVQARAALEAYPEPRQKKERVTAAKADKDSCRLIASRGEFQELYDALTHAMGQWGNDGGWPRAAALLRSLKEQGVVS